MNALFEQIVRAHPHTAQPGRRELLIEYVRLVDSLSALHAADSGDRDLADLIDVQQARLVRLATVLGLTQSRRFRADAAAAAASRTPTRKPWRSNGRG